MNELIEADLFQSMKEYGAGDWQECYHCGNCTAICPLTETNILFPRKPIKLLQMGLRKELESCVEPWLCYYCGECSEKCPRNANPGELMMTLRRYLTTAYDWTGYARKIYTSEKWEFISIGVLSTFVLILFLLFHGPMSTVLTPEGGVQLNLFAPARIVHIGDMLMAATVSFFLITNIFNMYRKIVGKEKNLTIPLTLYITEFKSLIFNFASQWKFNKCDGKSYWFLHWFLMSGYVILFILIVGFLGWFQTDKIHPWWHPQRIVGYYATLALLVGVGYFFYGRIKKSRERLKYSHISDWTFLVMLFLTALTGILVHFFRIGGLPMMTYYTYVAHLMILFPMIMIEVPFSKWSHLAYRPVAIYFSKIKEAALKQNKNSK